MTCTTIYSLPHTGERQGKQINEHGFNVIFIVNTSLNKPIENNDVIFVVVCRTSTVPSKYLMTVMIIVMMIDFYLFARHVSHCLLFPHQMFPP